MAERRRVLLVEDDLALGRVVADTLELEGYDVRWAVHGREGLEVLRDWRPDLIVLDLMMPVLDGAGFRAEQRRLPDSLAAIPVLVLSGAHDARAQTESLGAVGMVSKPFDLDDLLAQVAEAMRPSGVQGAG